MSYHNHATLIDKTTAETFFIAQHPQHVHNELRFECRRMQVLERTAFIKATEKKNEEIVDRMTAEEIGNRVVSWSVDSPINQSAALSLPFVLFARLAAIVIYGSDGGDADPDYDESVETQDAREEAERTGGNYADTANSLQVKN